LGLRDLERRFRGEPSEHDLKAAVQKAIELYRLTVRGILAREHPDREFAFVCAVAEEGSVAVRADRK
jgi:hypothetical protein